MVMDHLIVPITATTLTPFAYHSLMVHGGSATLPELISDRAVAFGIASALGWLNARSALPAKNYKGHLRALPYRTSLFTTDEPRLLAPLTRRLNIDDEGGCQQKFANAVNKGNVKTFFQTQEVPAYQEFHGAIFGLDPFSLTGEDTLVIRIGLHRNGMVKLKRGEGTLSVRLNAATAALFGQELLVDRYCLHTIQLSPCFPLKQAFSEVVKWK